MGRISLKTTAVLIVLVASALAPATLASGAEPGQPTTKAECMKGGWQDFSNAGFRNQGDCIRFVQTGVFTCRDLLGCVSYGEEEPLRLATALVTSGGLSFLGVDELQGVEIALDLRGPALGHAVELSNVDSMCSFEGGEAAATAIVTDPTIAAVIGTSCSGAAGAAAPIISDAGLSMVSPSNTAPELTDPDTHAAGYLRVAGNDRDQGVAMAEFVTGDGAATSAVIFDGSAYAGGLAEAFVETFEALGGTNLAFEMAEPDGSDVASVIAAIVAAGPPDVLFLPVLYPLGAVLVAEARATPVLDGTLLASADGLLVGDFFADVGADAQGMAFSATDFSYESTPEYLAFLASYIAEFGFPASPFHAMAADATNVILSAIEEVAVVDGSGTLHIGRQALRDALFATAGFEGLTGTITCDPLGDCGAHGYEVIVPVP